MLKLNRVVVLLYVDININITEGSAPLSEARHNNEVIICIYSFLTAEAVVLNPS